MSASSRILASSSLNKVTAGFGWSQIEKLPGMSAMMESLLVHLRDEARSSGELDKKASGFTMKMRDAAWDAIEKKVFKNKWDAIVEFNLKINLDEALKSKRLQGNYPYFGTDKWLKDVGPLGKKIQDIVEDVFWEHL